MYLYETHLHTFPVSICGKADVRQTLEFYKQMGYTGVFLTNHFLDGNLNIDPALPYEEKLAFYFSDYEKALELGEQLGIRVFLGVEISYKGTDFLIYGLDRDWYFAHPEIMELPKKQELELMREHGALVIQAHPYREDWYIDHIRLFPRSVHGVEVINASRYDRENEMARLYAEGYGLIPFAGSDNHVAERAKRLAGMGAAEPIADELDFVKKILHGQMEIFTLSPDPEKGTFL